VNNTSGDHITIRRSVAGSTDHPDLAQVRGSMITSGAAKELAVLRVATGFAVPWKLVGTLLGSGYSTTSATAWIHGGSPTGGFLKSMTSVLLDRRSSGSQSPGVAR